jgi:hypothetical protein
MSVPRPVSALIRGPDLPPLPPFSRPGPSLRALGKLLITRASHVEPDADGNWWADMGPVEGPVLGPCASRSEALQAEREWLVGRR